MSEAINYPIYFELGKWSVLTTDKEIYSFFNREKTNNVQLGTDFQNSLKKLLQKNELSKNKIKKLSKKFTEKYEIATEKGSQGDFDGNKELEKEVMGKIQVNKGIAIDDFSKDEIESKKTIEKTKNNKGMFNKISDLKEAWEKGIINLYPASSKNKPGYFTKEGKLKNTKIKIPYSIKDENARKWMEKNKKDYLSHGFFWDKSPFDSFEQLINISTMKDKEGELEVKGWCVLIGRGSNKEFLKKDNGDLRLACIDIDGYKPEDDPDNEIRKRSCDEIYKAISENADFNFFTERSQGGGYHIWYLTREQVLTKQVFHLKNLMFPKGSEFEGFTLNKETEFVEVFSKGGVRYISCSPTEKYNFLNNEPVELLKMKPVEDINIELKRAFVKAGFVYQLNQDKLSNEKPDYSYQKSDYDLSELQENILNCYRKGNAHNFRFPLIAVFRRANYTEEEVLRIFEGLQPEKGMYKVRRDIEHQFSVNFDQLATLSGLQKKIEEYCIPEAMESTKEFFNNFFKKEIVNSQCEIKWEELNDDEMFLKENKLFILYDAKYWINEAAKKRNPDEKCIDILSNIEEHNISTHGFLVVMQDKMGYHYGWSRTPTIFNITPNVYQKFLDETDPNRNKYIGQAANYFNILTCKNAVSLFLKYLKGKLKEDDAKNGLSSIKEKLNHNAKNYDYIKYIEKVNGISDDNLSKIHLMNNQYVINDQINKEMKIIEKRSIAKSVFTITGEQLKTDIYGEIDKDIIGNFAINGLKIFKDVLDEKDIKEAEIISKEGLTNIKFDKTKNFIESIDNAIGIQGRGDIAKKGILAVMNFIIENKVNLKKGFYSFADGIFIYNDKLLWFENNQVKKIEKPTTTELKKAISVLKKLFKETSIKDKSKISTIFKWFLSAPFAYLIRDGQINGEFIKFLNIIGESDTGKTALCFIFYLIWAKNKRNKGTDAHNATNFAELFKLSGFPLFIDEADDILNDDNKLHIIKSIYDTNYSRSKKEQINGSWKQKKQKALSIAVLTSNTYYESTEKSEVKRVLNINFNPEDAATDKGKNFKKIFNIGGDEGYKNSDFKALEALGREFFYEVKENYRKKAFEEILDSFLKKLDIKEVLLEYNDNEALKKNIDENYKKAIINLIIEDFNKIDRFKDWKTDMSRKDMFIKAIDEQRIPYLTLDSGNQNIRVTGGINKELKTKGYKFDNMNIRSIYHLFKEHNEGIDSEGKNMKYVNIPIKLLQI